MLGVNVGGIFLDLSPGTAMQLERQTPFFNAGTLASEYSLPLTFPYSDKNAKALGLVNHYYTRRLKKKVPDVRVFDNNNFSYTGDLIITGVTMNVNDVTKSTISGFYVTGVSSFFQKVKAKKLRELELGGVRSFVWTNNDPASPNKGFWQHIHETLPGTLEYSFAPIRNEKWAGSSDEGTPDWMNKLGTDGKLDYANNFNTLAPQVSLKYVLDRICAEHGWTFNFSEMTDVQWQTLFMPSFYAVSWQKIVQVESAPFFEYVPLPNIAINLQNHVPPEMLVTDLFIAIGQWYNWGFDWDSGRRICTLRPLKALTNGTRKDWSRFMPAQLKSDFSEDEKVYAFRSQIDSGDGLSSKPDFTKVTMGVSVQRFSELPAPGEDNFNLVVYVWKLNQYYQCRYNEDDRTYEWDVFADGVYDYEPTGYNQEVTTVASTMPVYKTLYRNNGVSDYYGLFPYCQQEGNWEGKVGEFKPWGLRLLFHRGMVWEANPLGNKGLLQYPYLTSICFAPTTEDPDLLWSTVWKHEFQGIDKGIIEYWFRDTLKYLAQTDVITGVLYLPRPELVNFRWSDIILLRNIPYIMQKITEVIPYNGTVQAELRRIG
jgi:hypothetical protein